MKKPFWCVLSEIYDDGRVLAVMTSRECKSKPANDSKELFRMEAYVDWFEIQAEAEAFREAFLMEC